MQLVQDLKAYVEWHSSANSVSGGPLSTPYLTTDALSFTKFILSIIRHKTYLNNRLALVKNELKAYI